MAAVAATAKAAGEKAAEEWRAARAAEEAAAAAFLPRESAAVQHAFAQVFHWAPAGDLAGSDGSDGSGADADSE